MNISDKKLASIRTECSDFFSHSCIFKLFRKVFKLTEKVFKLMEKYSKYL